MRTTELIEAKWGEFDLENARWDIPAERMKMRTPHIVPLARQALEVLEMLHDFTGSNEWLFPGDLNTAQPMSNNTILKALKRMGYKGRMSGHGFRGMASTVLHEKGYVHDHIELQLAHAPRNAVSAAYNHALYLLRHRGGAKDKKRNKNEVDFDRSPNFTQSGMPDLLRRLECRMNYFDAEASTTQRSAKESLAVRMDIPLSSSYCAPPANTL